MIHHHRRRPIVGPALAGLALLAAACGDDVRFPTDDGPLGSGVLEVVTATTGVDPDPNGYQIGLIVRSGLVSQTAAPNDTVRFEPLPEDDYIVVLSDVRDNCESGDDRIREISVSADEVTRIEFQLTCFSTAPLQDRIVFSSDRAGDDEIFAIRSDGSDPFNVSRDTTGDDLMPAVSPDGRQVAYISDRNGSLDLHVMGSRGTAKERFTLGPESDRNPAWAPGGIALAWIRQSGLTLRYFIAITSGQPATTLSLDPTSRIAWSPGAGRIALAAPAGDPDIFVVDSTAADLNITNHPARDIDPAWSPDGARIAFASDRDGDLDIYLVNADGSGIVQLTDHPGADRSPAWSPDGTRIAFQTDRDGNLEIYVMADDGSGLVNLTGHPAADRHPTWSP